jgi:hypothetical protein
MALGAVAVAVTISIAGCGSDPGLTGAKTPLPATGGETLLRTTTIDQLDDEHLTTIELRHFAIYNRFRAAVEAAAESTGSPLLTNADAQHNLYSGASATSGAEHFGCPGEDRGM